MGTDKREKQSNSKRKGFLNGNNSNATTASWDWNDIDPGRLHGLVNLVTSRGGAIRFGYSRDGNAGSIGVYYGEDRDTVYLRPGTDGEDALKLIESTFEALPDTRGKQPGTNG